MTDSWTVILEEDENGDVILPLGEEFMKKYGWEIGDKLDWELTDTGAILTNLSAKEREAGKVA
jgi:hypothetical protein